MPALLHREARHVDERQLAAPQLVGHQVLDRWRDPGAVGRGRPGGGLALEDPDVAVRRPRAGAAAWPSRCRDRCRTGPPASAIAWPGRAATALCLPRPTTTSRYLKMGSLTIGSSCSPVTPAPEGDVGEPVRDQHGLLAGGRDPGRDLHRPGEPAAERLHQRPGHELGERGGGDDRAAALGAPCAARTAACASAPSMTICDAMPSSRVPPGSASCRPGSG